MGEFNLITQRVSMKLVILLGFLACMVTAQPLQQCHILEAFPYFKGDLVHLKTEMSDAKSRAGLKNRLVFLTELSRFLNRKAPFLLQEFAESKKIFETKKKLGLMELEADLTRGMLQQSRPRFARSIPEAEFLARGPIVKNEDEPEELEVQEEPEVVDPSDIGEAAGVLTEQIIGTLPGSAQDVIQLFQEVVTSVGGVLEEALPPSAWNFICIATWYPLQDEHCAEARCAVCTPAVMSAVSVCRTAQQMDHKCIQEVMGEGFCNYCIADFI